jgi:hypothetical protein
MGVYAGPDVVENGLVLALDAGNSKSYPGSGTTWTDLSGNGNDGTLVNGVGYSGDKLGSLVFDGVDDVVNISEINLQPPWTQSIVYKNLESTSTIAFRAAIHGNTGTSRPGFIRVYNDIIDDTSSIRILLRYRDSSGTWRNFSDYVGPNGSSYVPFSQQDDFWVNRIMFLSITCSSNFIYNYYIDGNLVFTRNRSTSNDLDNGLRVNMIGARGTGTTEPLNGNIYSSIFYNRELTAQEIQQNYNATKSRFGS